MLSKWLSLRHQLSHVCQVISCTRLNLIFAGVLLLGSIPAATSLSPLLPVCFLQGSGFSSPYQGQTVRTRGVVTLDLDQASQRGFFIQAAGCDTNPATSDGIFVYLAERIDVVSSGDRVELTGLVQEYYGNTELQLAPANVIVLSHGNALPAVVELNPPFQNAATRAYFEPLEGMYVGLSQGQVVGPTDSDDRTWLVNANLGVERVFYADSRGTGEVVCSGDDGLFKVTPAAQVGDQIQGLVGALDFRFSAYCLEPALAPQVLPDHSSSERAEPSAASIPAFSLSTFNLAGLFDTLDDPLTEDQVLSLTEYQRRLRKRALAIGQELGHPAIIALQEVENLTVLQDLIARPELQASYSIVWQEGLDQRGLDVALLYRPDQVSLVDFQTRQGCTGLVDGLEPDGNDDPLNPQNALTCDLNGDGILDGNRLFSRPPLLVHLTARPSGALTADLDLWLIVCHLKSKVQDTSTIQYTLPRRLEQARFVADLAEEVLASHPTTHLVVLGDLNDHPDSQPLSEFFRRGFRNAMDWAEEEHRYTYIYQGISQTLDYVLMFPQPDWLALLVKPAHINADFPDTYLSDIDTPIRSSDHDPMVVNFTPVEPSVFFPMIRR
jgi:predicted extracellular nuclease